MRIRPKVEGRSQSAECRSTEAEVHGLESNAQCLRVSATALDNRGRLSYNRAMSTIYIHQGHGDKDSGAVGADGYKESDFSREVGERLATKLRELGHTVFLSRRRLPDADSAVIAKDANAAEADFVLSIHANSVDDAPSACGAEVFITGNTQLARDVATKFGELYRARFPGRKWRGVKLQGESQHKTLAILQKTKAPALLVECGFLSNAEELAWLESQDGEDALADLLCSALTQYV